MSEPNVTRLTDEEREAIQHNPVLNDNWFARQLARYEADLRAVEQQLADRDRRIVELAGLLRTTFGMLSKSIQRRLEAQRPDIRQALNGAVGTHDQAREFYEDGYADALDRILRDEGSVLSLAVQRLIEDSHPTTSYADLGLLAMKAIRTVLSEEGAS